MDAKTRGPNDARVDRGAISALERRRIFPAMNADRIRNVVAKLHGEEMPGALWIVTLCLRCGTMPVAEADEWRRQISARLAFLEITTPLRACH